MIVLCAWCGVVLNRSTFHTGVISHGICETCREQVMKAYEEAKHVLQDKSS
jgi:uncharacterized Zn finger protein (UPF0148 family)